MKIGKQRGGEPVILKDIPTARWIFGWVIRIAMLIALVAALIWSQNNLLLTKTKIFTAQNIPKTFVGYNVVHVSDLHNTSLNVVSKVSKLNPDLILVTGGYTDDHGGFNKSVSIINKLSSIAPTYYILGESDEIVSSQIISNISGATLIEGDTVVIPSPQVNETEFIDTYIGSRIIGLADKGNQDALDYIQYTRDSLAEDSNLVLQVTGVPYDQSEDTIIEYIYDLIGTDKSIFEIVLTGNAHLFDTISKADIDMVFTGSVHGDKTKYPPYTKGIYAKDGTTMVLSGGIGNIDGYSSRIFNFPEITSLTLSDGTIKDENPIEKVLGYLMPDVNTRFDNDGGFTEHRYSYTDRYGTTTQGANPGG